MVDVDPLLDHLEPLLSEGGNVVDHHTCEDFPERWFDIVVVLRSSTESMFDRLVDRGYPKPKRDENLQAEIMQVCLEEAHESYESDIIHVMQSDTIEDMERNVRDIANIVKSLV